MAGWPSESWPWARPLGGPRGCIRHPVKVCLAAGFSSGSRHPSKGWVRPKQAGWEFRVQGLGFRGIKE